MIELESFRQDKMVWHRSQRDTIELSLNPGTGLIRWEFRERFKLPVDQEMKEVERTVLIFYRDWEWTKARTQNPNDKI